jgi:hypothetical protein
MGGPKTYGSYGSATESGTLVKSQKEVTKQKKSSTFLLFIIEGRKDPDTLL